LVLGCAFCAFGALTVLRTHVSRHGGYGASTFAERSIFEQFKAAKERGMDPESAFKFAYGETDRQYLEHAREQAETVVGRPTDLFAGSCAVGAYVDFSSGMIYVSNLGDSRAVFGAATGDGGRTETIPLSWDHACEHEGERTRVCEEHPGERPYDVVINCGGDDGYPDDYRVKGVCSFTRSIGDFQMKDKEAAATYNSHTQGYKVVPRPGVAVDGGAINKPYILNEPTSTTQVRARAPSLAHAVQATIQYLPGRIRGLGALTTAVA
jgi:serine/threonine protein phosphatase PrpC